MGKNSGKQVKKGGVGGHRGTSESALEPRSHSLINLGREKRNTNWGPEKKEDEDPAKKTHRANRMSGDTSPKRRKGKLWSVAIRGARGKWEILDFSDQR